MPGVKQVNVGTVGHAIRGATSMHSAVVHATRAMSAEALARRRLAQFDATKAELRALQRLNAAILACQIERTLPDYRPPAWLKRWQRRGRR